MSVDRRTRIDGAAAPFDPAEFFEHDLPDAFGHHASMLEPAVRRLGVAPLTIEVDDDAWTLTAVEGRVEVKPGADAAARLRLDAERLLYLATDHVTPVGWWTNGTLELAGADLGEAVDWWLLLRGALDGVAPHAPGDVTFVDADGASLDLTRRFRRDSSLDEMRVFLEEAGYLHIESVFTEDEMAAVSADMDRAAPGYHPGDGNSWWARTSEGVNRLVRMQRFDDVSPAVAEFVQDDRLQRIGRITGDGHLWGSMEDNRIEALVKPLGIVEGLSDLPWHKDCALGRHSYECCGITAGVSVTGADATCGQLRVLAGSHRALMWPSFMRADNDLPEIDLPTRTGDVTVHLSCTLHMAQAPVVRERRVLYTSFRLPPPDPGADAIARARVRAIREAAPVTVSQ